jgi:hypothetical protein
MMIAPHLPDFDRFGSTVWQGSEPNARLTCRKKCDTSRDLHITFAAQRTLAQDDIKLIHYRSDISFLCPVLTFITWQRLSTISGEMVQPRALPFARHPRQKISHYEDFTLASRRRSLVLKSPSAFPSKS